MMPPTRAPNVPLPKAARVINIITALTGVAASGLFGLFAILMGIGFFWLGSPPVCALLTVILLYHGCGAYGAAVTRIVTEERSRF